jgi:hypothetical protein
VGAEQEHGRFGSHIDRDDRKMLVALYDEPASELERAAVTRPTLTVEVLEDSPA